MRKAYVFSTIVSISVLILGNLALPAIVQSQQAKRIELKFSTQAPPMIPVAQADKRWADMIEQRSGGRLKIKCYFGGSLAGQYEVFRAVQTGIADIGYFVIGTDPGLQPLNMVTLLPFIWTGAQSWQSIAPMYWELYNKFPELQKEYQGLKLLTLTAIPPDQFFFTKKQVRVPADMKGMKVIAKGGWADVMQLIGAAPLNVGVADWYTSLDRGLVEGHIAPFIAVQAFKTLDLFKHITLFGPSGASTRIQTYIMNPETWKALPPDLQKILEEGNKWHAEEIMKFDTAGDQRAIDAAKALKQVFTQLTPQEIKTWFDIAKPVHDKWIEENEGRGPAKTIYEETVRLVTQYSSKKIN